MLYKYFIYFIFLAKKEAAQDLEGNHAEVDPGLIEEEEILILMKKEKNPAPTQNPNQNRDQNRKLQRRVIHAQRSKFIIFVLRFLKQ